MSSTDVQNVRDWKEDVSGGTSTYDPVTYGLHGLEDTNLDWIDKRVNDDVPGGDTGSTGSTGSARGPDPVQFETRRQEMGRKAGAASARRSRSDADLLGFMAPTRRIGQARKILGY